MMVQGHDGFASHTTTAWCDHLEGPLEGFSIPPARIRLWGT